METPTTSTHVCHVVVVHQQALVVADGHLQQLGALPEHAGVQRKVIILLRHFLLLDAHGVHVAVQPRARHEATMGVQAAVGRVALLLQDQVFRRRQVRHDRVRRQPGEAGHRRQVAEHDHAAAKVGVHAPVGAQEVAG